MAQIKMRIRADEKTTTGTVFNIEMGENSYQTIVDKETAKVANACLEYGYRVYLQKTIGEGQSTIEGKRDDGAVASHLDKVGMAYTTSEWVKGTKAVDPKLAMLKEYSVEEIAEMVAMMKAQKG